MDVSGTEEGKKLEEAKLTSAAAFVEGGTQEACDDSCSICLEEFCESDPSTVTGCKHEFHLQCILEWCQRSSQCPMCWQPISLKDPASQGLLDAVVQERDLRLNPLRNSAIFQHPTLGEFEIQHLPVDVNEAELEERIFQHLAAIGRTRHFGRRERHRGRLSGQGHPHYLVFSPHPDAHLLGGQDESDPASSNVTHPFSMRTEREASPSTPPSNHLNPREMGSASTTSPLAVGQHASQSSIGPLSSPRSEDRAGPSDLQSFSEALKSRLNTMSMRYKDSISKSTRGWKERWFSRNSAVSDIGSEVRREVNAGIATVTRMMERLETGDNGRAGNDSVPNSSESSQGPDTSIQHGAESFTDAGGNHLTDIRAPATCGTQSCSD